jgi:hypothetical protein
VAREKVASKKVPKVAATFFGCHFLKHSKSRNKNKVIQKVNHTYFDSYE